LKDNIAFSDYPRSYYLYFKRYFDAFLRYQKAYKNFLHVLKQVRSDNFPIRAILRNGKIITLNSKVEAATTAYGQGNFVIENNLLIINQNNFPEIKLKGWENNADLYEIFFLNSYKFLPVIDSQIIDIGANIADSSIYFALQGAEKVIAVELVPQNFEFAKENIELNNLSDKISLILGGCSNKRGHVIFDPTKTGMGHSVKSSDTQGIEVPLLTLEDIIDYSDSESLLLKLDCEGCEYDTILSTSDKTLRNFSHIFIEYHFGYLDLRDKLKNAGFDITIGSPSYYRHPFIKDKKSFIGYLYAKRKSDKNL